MLCALGFKGKVPLLCWEARSAADINNSSASKGRSHTESWETGNQQISPASDWLFRLGQSSNVIVWVLWEVWMQDGFLCLEIILRSMSAVYLWIKSCVYCWVCNWLRLKTWMEQRLVLQAGKGSLQRGDCLWVMVLHIFWLDASTCWIQVSVCLQEPWWIV